MPVATATLLLPERTRFGAQRLSESTGQWLARADAQRREGAEHHRSQLARCFDVLPRGWPVAAATRQQDAGDAAHSAWLRADPAFVQPDINSARLLAYGQALALTAADTAALLPALKPLFGDAGFTIDAPTPSRWYLRLPMGAKLPGFAAPADALGDDMLAHLPGHDGGADDHALDEGRRWRALLSEAQVMLHNHPHNQRRIESGLTPVNSLWFWGAGVLPDHVRTAFDSVCSDDEALIAFAALAKVPAADLPARWPGGEGDRLFDLRQLRDLGRLDHDWLMPLTEDLRAGRVQRATLDFADGQCFELRASQRWRFWRRPLRSLAT